MKNNEKIIEQFKLFQKQIQMDIDFSTNDKTKIINCVFRRLITISGGVDL